MAKALYVVVDSTQNILIFFFLELPRRGMTHFTLTKQRHKALLICENCDNEVSRVSKPGKNPLLGSGNTLIKRKCDNFFWRRNDNDDDDADVDGGNLNYVC